MNFRLLPILAFIGWSAICWRWYVCEIKQACKPKVTSEVAATPPLVIEPMKEEVDATTGAQMQAENETAITPMNSETVGASKWHSKRLAAPSGSKTETATMASSDVDINRFSVVEDGDLITIHFPYNSVENEANADAESFLAALAAKLKESKRKLLITGHTDSVGDGVSNEKVALRRAKNIREKLISHGVAAEQLTCQTYGERKPIATNDNPQGRYKNRRVEFLLK